MRGFPDMQRRREALEAFYDGPIWKVHAAAANATMVDVDDVLLLRPAAPSTGFEPQPRRPRQGTDVPAAHIAATICSLNAPADPDVLIDTLLPALAEMTQPALATFVEEPSENTFPALPVRTGEHVVVWIPTRRRRQLARADRARPGAQGRSRSTPPCTDREIAAALNEPRRGSGTGPNDWHRRQAEAGDERRVEEADDCCDPVGAEREDIEGVGRPGASVAVDRVARERMCPPTSARIKRHG